MKKLTLNIDDLGLSPAVNEAVCHTCLVFPFNGLMP